MKMKKVDKYKKEIESYIEKQLERIKKADKISKIQQAIDTLDQDLLEYSSKLEKKFTHGKYMSTNKELDSFFDQED